MKCSRRRHAKPDGEKHSQRYPKQRAKARGHNLNAEILAILFDQDAREGRRSAMEEVLPRIDKLRAEIAERHPVKCEAYQLVREDRSVL